MGKNDMYFSGTSTYIIAQYEAALTWPIWCNTTNPTLNTREQTSNQAS